MIRADAQPMRTPTELALTLELEHGSDAALLRVMAVLHRRRCRVTGARFRCDTGPFDHLELRVQAPPSHAARVEHWLAALVDVRYAEAEAEVSAGS